MVSRDRGVPGTVIFYGYYLFCLEYINAEVRIVHILKYIKKLYLGKEVYWEGCIYIKRKAYMYVSLAMPKEKVLEAVLQIRSHFFVSGSADLVVKVRIRIYPDIPNSLWQTNL